MQSPAPSEYFPNIKFNYSFYTTGDTKVTLEYVNNNFLKCTGYAYSRSINTTFNGIIYALGGIETTNIYLLLFVPVANRYNKRNKYRHRNY